MHCIATGIRVANTYGQAVHVHVQVWHYQVPVGWATSSCSHVTCSHLCKHGLLHSGVAAARGPLCVQHSGGAALPSARENHITGAGRATGFFLQRRGKARVSARSNSALAVESNATVLQRRRRHGWLRRRVAHRTAQRRFWMAPRRRRLAPPPRAHVPR